MTQFTDLVAIAVTRPDGGLTIRRIPSRASEQCYDIGTAKNMGMTLNDAVWSRDVTDELIVADLEKCGLGGLPWRRIREEDLPERDEFRNAWRDTGNIEIDMPAAREIAHQRRRALREEDLAPLDKEINISIADALKVKQVEARRQTVRDRYAVMQRQIDDAATVPDIKRALEQVQ